MDPRDIIIRPIVTEKTTGLLADNQYTFEVALGANKHQIRDASRENFKVRGVNVNTITAREGSAGWAVMKDVGLTGRKRL